MSELEALKGTRLAKLSLAGVEDLLGTCDVEAALFKPTKVCATEGVDLPDIGGVGRRVG